MRGAGSLASLVVLAAVASMAACGSRTLLESAEAGPAARHLAPLDAGEPNEAAAGDGTMPAPQERAATSDAADAPGSCDFEPSQYDDSCQNDSDCVAVPQGDLCNPGYCACPTGAINVAALERYNADIAAKTAKPAALQPTLICNCPLITAPSCRQGKCAR